MPTPRLLPLCLTVSLAVCATAAEPPAFPGAVGQGALSKGGRGGVVYHVTTLDDYAPHKGEKEIKGSLRHAVRAEIGPRTVVFDVAGVIRLHEPLEVHKDQITIAGQTSPGGITLWGYPFEVTGASDVVVRHLRVRCGDFNTSGAHADRGTGAGDLDAGTANAVHVGNGSERVIFDHVSATWGIDENFSVTVARDVTVQNCLIAEALNRSYHPKGPHGYGSLVRGELTADDQAECRGGYTFFSNLWAHNRARNPSIGGQQRLPSGRNESERLRTDVNVVNNVVYDWGSMPTHRSELGDVRVNLVANYYVNGAAKKSKYIFRGDGEEDEVTLLYHRGNLHDADQDKDHDGLVTNSPEAVERAFNDMQPGELSDAEPFCFYHSVADETLDAERAYQRVVEGVGASLWRDPIDARIVATLEERSGNLIDSQESYRGADGVLAGIDDVPERRRPESYDSDADGMPDSFETSNGLDPSDPSDANRVGLSDEGYTNLEVFLDEATHTP